MPACARCVLLRLHNGPSTSCCPRRRRDHRKAVFMISKPILAKVMPPSGAPGLYGFRRCRRRVRYSEIAHGRCGYANMASNTSNLYVQQLCSLGIAWVMQTGVPARRGPLTPFCSAFLCLKFTASYFSTCKAPGISLALNEDYGHCESQHYNGCSGRYCGPC